MKPLNTAHARTGNRKQTVVFVRHGIARHNLIDPQTGKPPDLTDKNLLDPPLVRDGKFQAIEMGDRLKTWWSANQTGQIELVISSPLTRCLQTATLAFLPGDRYANEINEPRMTCVESIREAYGMHYPDQRRKKSFLMVSIVVVQSYHCQLISSTSLTPFVVAVAINSL
jgi:broad specificity phosphatase PhoE